jgi:hypothetical protein
VSEHQYFSDRVILQYSSGTPNTPVHFKMASTTSVDLEKRRRLPTLFEVLSRYTLAPVDLFSFYIYMRDQQRSVDYLDFWYAVLDTVIGVLLMFVTGSMCLNTCRSAGTTYGNYDGQSSWPRLKEAANGLRPFLTTLEIFPWLRQAHLTSAAGMVRQRKMPTNGFLHSCARRTHLNLPPLVAHTQGGCHRTNNHLVPVS